METIFTMTELTDLTSHPDPECRAAAHAATAAIIELARAREIRRQVTFEEALATALDLAAMIEDAEHWPDDPAALALDALSRLYGVLHMNEPTMVTRADEERIERVHARMRETIASYLT